MRTSRYTTALLGPALSLSFGLAACGTAQDDPSTAHFQIESAPLTLDGVTEACYDLAVFAGPNTAAPLVWSRAGVCASRFGDGKSAISYVGPCDGAQPAHTVQLVLDTLMVGATTLDDQLASSDPDFINPCPAPGGCTLPATCAENADTPVVFNLTIMRRAQQGFFDIAVDLEDLFCSAKADCVSANGPLELLHNPRLAGAPRDQTLVMGFVCTAGANTDTRLHWLDANIVCGDLRYDLLRALVDGQAGLQGPIEPASVGANSLVFEHAYYLGEESLAPYGSLFSNLAIGLDTRFLGVGPHVGCRLQARATASDGPLGTSTPELTKYPLVTWDIPLHVGNSTALACTAHPLDGGNGLATDYTPLTTTGEPIAFSIDGNGAGQVTVEDVGYTPPPDPNASPNDTGVVSAPQLFITAADGMLRLGYVVDSQPATLQRFFLVDSNLQAIGRSSAGPASNAVIGSYTVTGFVNCSNQSFTGTPGQTYRIILADAPSGDECTGFNAYPRANHRGDFEAIARTSVLTPASFPGTGLTLTLAPNSGTLRMTTDITGSLGTAPTLFLADPNFGPAIGIGRIGYQPFANAGTTGPTQLLNCSGNPVPSFSGTREYLVFAIDGAVTCADINSTDLSTRLLTSGFVKVITP